MAQVVVAVNIQDRLKELGIVLPPAPKAAANYVPVQKSGNLLFLSGHLPFMEDGTTLITGRIGNKDDNNDKSGGNDDDDNTCYGIEYGYRAARQCGYNLIATLNEYLQGDLEKVQQVVKVFGIVQSTSTFHEQHKVLNGCSDLMVEVFGTPVGVHSRSAIGTTNLPLNIAVEVEMIVQIKEE